jgi:hypothetical protein
LVRFARFEDSIGDQEIEVAANSRRGEAEALPQNDRCRRAILENRAGDSITGAEIVDFHNSIVS